MMRFELAIVNKSRLGHYWPVGKNWLEMSKKKTNDCSTLGKYFLTSQPIYLDGIVFFNKFPAYLTEI